LTVKKVLFTGMGAGSRTVRARVIGWYCPRCTVKDSDWQRPAHEHPSSRPKAEEKNHLVKIALDE
jgi:hypothetical protein